MFLPVNSETIIFMIEPINDWSRFEAQCGNRADKTKSKTNWGGFAVM